jgi:hypothetical protein
MKHLKLLAGLGLVLCCVLLSISTVLAQDSIADLRRRAYQQQPPPTTAVYMFCKSWRGSSQRNTIYYSGVFATDGKNPTPAQQAFLQFIENKYSYRGTGQNVNTDVSCSEAATQAQAATNKQTDMDRQRAARYLTLVETGWATPPSAPAQRAPTPTASADAQKPDWQYDVDWSIGHYTTDPAGADCPGQYTATEPKCITGGGRACLMGSAIDSAKHDNCSYAFRLTLICQCHNPKAQQHLGEAGPQKVCEYEKTK